MHYIDKEKDLTHVGCMGYTFVFSFLNASCILDSHFDNGKLLSDQLSQSALSIKKMHAIIFFSV